MAISAHTPANLNPEASVYETGEADGQAGGQTAGESKKERVELGLHFKVLGHYDCCSHLKGFGERGEKPRGVVPSSCAPLAAVIW